MTRKADYTPEVWAKRLEAQKQRQKERIRRGNAACSALGMKREAVVVPQRFKPGNKAGVGRKDRPSSGVPSLNDDLFRAVTEFRLGNQSFLQILLMRAVVNESIMTKLMDKILIDATPQQQMTIFNTLEMTLSELKLKRAEVSAKLGPGYTFKPIPPAIDVAFGNEPALPAPESNPTVVPPKQADAPESNGNGNGAGAGH